ncbi:MAG: flagellar filament capping protein FliD [Burkholderiales bacterium]|nr:flagellar filament capping protein FliD [Burkholderiales bacterium]
MATTLAAPGIGSGLDINAIVEKLMSVERKPLEQIAKQEATTQARISAFGSIKGALAAFQSAAAGVSTGSAFRATYAQVSDIAVLSASTSSDAASGRYAVEVSALAQSQKLASAGFAATTDAVGTGTITFEFGTTSGSAFTPDAAVGSRSVTIAAGQDSLAGVRDAINAAKIGVTATIVDDGSAAGKRLVLSSDTPGAARSLRISVADDDGNPTDAAGLSRLAWDPAGSAGNGKNLEQKQAAQNAALTVDGIAISAASNVVSGAIPGVSLTLTRTNAGSPATVTVAANTPAVSAAVGGFVKAYNDVVALLDNLSRYDPATRKASTLTGDSTVRALQTQLRGLLTSASSVVPGRSLADAGVTLQRDGKLAFDATKLGATLTSDPLAVEKLFATVGRATDARIGVFATARDTLAGSYTVGVTQLARAARVDANAAAALVYTAGVDDTISASIDGRNVTVQLAANYADAGALVADLGSKLNGALAQAGTSARVVVSATGGVLRIESAAWGSSSSVAISGNGAVALLGAAPVTTTGQDVAGTLDGVAATGSGRTLTAATGSPAAGLALTIDGGALGARGTVDVSHGAGAQFAARLALLADDEGIVASRSSSMQKNLDSLALRREAIDRRLAQVEAAYRAQFVALDGTISSLNATSTYLAQQLANLPKVSSS